jgi:hypothetical protein
MFHKNIKLIIAGLLVITGIWQFTENNIGNGIFLILLTAIPIFFTSKNEFILLAFLKLRKQDFEGAKKHSLKPRNCSAQTTKVLQLPAWNHAVTNNINQSEKIF